MILTLHSNSSIKLQDSEKGEVFARISFETPLFKIRGGMNDMVSVIHRNIVYKGRANLSAQILTREERYKYVIQVIDREKFEHLNNDNYVRMEKTTNEQDKLLEAAFENYTTDVLIQDIKQHMSAKSNLEDTDW